jgi:hypothetical protein
LKTFILLMLVSGSSIAQQNTCDCAGLFVRAVDDFATLNSVGLYNSGQFLPNGDLYDVYTPFGVVPWQSPFTVDLSVEATPVPGNVYPDGSPRALDLTWWSPVDRGLWDVQIYPDVVYPNGNPSTFELDFSFEPKSQPAQAPEISTSGAGTALTLLLGGLLVLRGRRAMPSSVPIVE